jgi:hypothetical protein
VRVGWVVTPTSGAVGVDDGILIITLPDATDVHELEFVTVKVYVPGESPDIVVLVPVPVVVTPP